MSRNKAIKKVNSLIKLLDTPSFSEKASLKKGTYEKTLFKCIDECLPTYLYKYRGTEKNQIDAFKNDKVFLNEPLNFNDPTDCMAYVNPHAIVELSGMTSLDIDPLIPFDERTDEEKNKIGQTLNIANNAIDTIGAVSKLVKVACFSEKNSEPLMWSHYAESHKGFAIRYKVSNFIFSECKKCEKRSVCFRTGFLIFPVSYEVNRADISVYAAIRGICINKGMGEEKDMPFPLMPLIQKNECWKYEREWRIICKNLDTEYIEIKPDAVYLGYRINFNLAKELYSIAQKKKINIYRMYIDYYNPKFVMEERNVENIEDIYMHCFGIDYEENPAFIEAIK